MLVNGTPVVVRNLGDYKEYRGIVVGIVNNNYIVKLIDKYHDYAYDCKVFIPSVVFEDK